MSIFNHAFAVINEVYADEYVKQHMTPLKVTQALAKAGLLAPEPQIIRTRDELAALDPDTLLEDTDGSTYVAQDAQKTPGDLELYADDLPAVVLLEGDEYRAARQALTEGA